jgi:predicted Holliday junction resolvase-like endonuclease
MAEAVSKIQKSLNIRENGVFDANTRAELSKLVSSEIRTKSESRKNNEPKITAEVKNETTKIKSVVVEEKVIAEDYSTKEQTVK